MKYTIFDIAYFILEQAEEKLQKISHKKLQKLCYYVYSWYVYLYNEDINNLDKKMFNSDFEAWVHGPVSPSLYRHLKGVEDIFNIKKEDIKKEYTDLCPEIKSDILETLDMYIDYSANELESISHQERPWINGRTGCTKWDFCRRQIKDQDIFLEYSERN